MTRTILGFDVGGTKCAVLLAHVDNGIRLLDRFCFPTESHKGFQQAKDRLFAAGHEMLKKHGVTKDRLCAVGMSCGGPLDGRKGLILSPPHLPGWDNIPIVDMLEQEFGAPAFLQNDANACALVEWQLGAGRGVDNMVFLTMGTGFGAGIIASGRLVEGACCLAGEVGHVRLESDGPMAWGKAGSVEVYCSGAGVATTACAYTEERLAEGHSPAWTRDGVTYENISAKVIAGYAHAGDTDGIAVFERVGEQLGKTLAILLDVLNPDCIVIGSIFARCEKLLRPAMERALLREALPDAVAACRILPAQTGEQLGDFASILAACHGLGIEAAPRDTATRPAVARHLTRLLERYPQLADCETALLDAFATMRRSYRNGGKLLICGNGGSAADAGHIVGELMKGFLLKRKPDKETAQLLGSRADRLQQALPAIDLTQHIPLSTAFQNDVEPELIFAQQVYGYGRRGDVLLCISTSGNAKNVAEAAHTAQALGLEVISLTGKSGGLLRDVSDVAVCVAAEHTPDIQELHLPVYHCLCAMLEEEFFGEE